MYLGYHLVLATGARNYCLSMFVMWLFAIAAFVSRLKMATVMLSCVLCVSSAFGHWNSQSALVAVARRFLLITSFHAILLWIGPVWGCFQNRMTYIDCSQMTRRSVLSWLAFRPGAKVS